ncbi:hypothetical protein PR048_026919 [Dryococelus australis]|uniref:Uncharacterized protein n=1 Tax=Dryococelus australis TaxID=614101 RepID=A0ABQ9GMN2_9NEOP|nr:hypothetical protein PR048_026919 [Dryococelus australis]
MECLAVVASISGFSPAELLFGLVQTILQLRLEHGMLQSIREHDNRLKTRNKFSYDRRHDIKELEPLAPGERVWIQDLKKDRVQFKGQPSIPGHTTCHQRQLHYD